MPKQKQSKRVTKAATKKAPETEAVRGPKTEKEEDLVVFAFRLALAEREVIHKAAGPGKASRFVRALAVAAANGDEEAVLKLLGGPAPAVK